jgi:glycosyltransferase involved in cell wall biosynthesis
MKVSVLIITYNHERFIADAIQSVLLQDVNFAYEIVIGEDCSQDRTRDIILAFQSRYPHKVRLLPAEEHLGMHANFDRTLQACRGQYIALLEGDDYWTSPQKLQRQVTFLDAHPECAICFHNVCAVDGRGEAAGGCSVGPEQSEISTLEDVITRHFTPTCSLMVRRGLVRRMPDWVSELAMADWPFVILNAQHGTVGYINEVMAAYRIHSGGVYSSQSNMRRIAHDIRAYGKLNRHLGLGYSAIIRSAVAKKWEDLIAVAINDACVAPFVEILDGSAEELRLAGKSRRCALAKVHLGLVFASHEARDRKGVWRHLAKAVWYGPGCLRSRGVWSIGAEAYLGRRVSGWLRRGARRCHRRLAAVSS